MNSEIKRKRFRHAYLDNHWAEVVIQVQARMPKLAARPADYRMIAAWGALRGHRLAYIRSWQQMAWTRNAPLDVIEFREGRWRITADLPASERVIVEWAAQEDGLRAIAERDIFVGYRATE